METFSADEDYYNAVSMCVYQIGEISGGLSDDFRADTKQQMEWHKIRGMRNIFAHHYHKMNKETVWMTATENIPAMLDFCNKIIADNSEDFAPPQRPEWI
ncbi:MAG: DUF86 domain-containing protein [Clostridia bacterium]|nr:DUF86 domain-containing protein [Clostridia bacterium]